jgi:hypothetical protein
MAAIAPSATPATWDSVIVFLAGGLIATLGFQASGESVRHIEHETGV